jgi:MinD-like ATPase involved in chromosome partitioning or flagellar assembly
MFSKRVTVFMGHYGSGKTFVSVNYALALAKLNKSVSIYDLDIVNPYFRTVDAKKTLAQGGVELVVSPFAQTNVDIPAMNAKSYKMIDDLSSYAVADIGGDDRGALALGRFSGKLKEENNYDALLVLNKFRPETRDIDGALSIIEEIESTGKLPFTGIVNNANLGNETTVDTILSGLEFSKELSKQTGLPVKFTAVRKDLLCGEIQQKIKEILLVSPIKYGDWL